MESNAFVLLKSAGYNGDPTYQTALYYGDTNSVLATVPSASTPERLVSALRAMANAIERGTVLTYERQMSWQVVDLPPTPTPIAVGAANRVVRNMRPDKSR